MTRDEDQRQVILLKRKNKERKLIYLLSHFAQNAQAFNEIYYRHMNHGSTCI